MKSQKLYYPAPGAHERYPQLQPILSRPIKWELIRQQYDEMIKYRVPTFSGGKFPLRLDRAFS